MNRVASLACVSFKSGAALAQPAHIASVGSWTGRASLLNRASLLWATLLCCLFTLAQPARAQTIITTDTIINNVIDDIIYVEGSPMVSVVSGGSVTEYINAYNSSTVNVSGGSIAYGLYAFDTSTVNVSGGYMQSLQAFGTSTVSMSGGSVGADLAAFDTSTVNLSGGSIGYTINVLNSGTINVYGTSLSLTGPSTDGYGQTYYTLSGTLQDGTAINKTVYLFSGAMVSQVHLFNNDPFVALKVQVQALADNGTLNKGNANALLVKLNAAQSAIAAGDTAGARDSLTAFVNQVNAFTRTGKLSAAQGQALTTAAQAILNSLH